MILSSLPALSSGEKRIGKGKEKRNSLFERQKNILQIVVCLLDLYAYMQLANKVYGMDVVTKCIFHN